MTGRHTVFILLFTIATFFLSCSREASDAIQRRNHLFMQADSLIEQHPDSVLHLLQDVDYNALDEEGQAHYGLLLTAARYKLYQPVDTTFINRSIDYYSSHLRGDKRGWGSNSSPLRGDKRGVSLFPLTGRSHQLRVHCAHPDGLGIPILGDALYGKPADRLYLHAAEITFRHPKTGELLTFTNEPEWKR